MGGMTGRALERRVIVPPTIREGENDVRQDPDKEPRAPYSPFSHRRPHWHVKPCLQCKAHSSANAQGMIALSCCRTMVYSAVNRFDAIRMRRWLSTFARFAPQFGSDALKEARLV